MSRKCFKLVCVVAVLAFCGFAQADIVNPSFELPALGSGVDYEMGIQSWDTYGIGWTLTCKNNGVNVGNVITGVDGQQFQEADYTPGLDPYMSVSQFLTDTYSVHTKYVFTIGLATRGNYGTIPSNAALYVDLGYDASGTFTPLSSTPLAGSALSSTKMTDFSAPAYTVSGIGDPAYGKQIAIWVAMDSAGLTSPAVLILDNARLTSSAIPEPSTMVLLTPGLVGLLCYAWRKRK